MEKSTKHRVALMPEVGEMKCSSSHFERMAALHSAPLRTAIFSRRFHSPALRAELFLAGE